MAVAIPSYVINSTSTGITRILNSSSVPEVARFSVNMQWLNIFGGSPSWSVTAVLLFAQLASGGLSLVQMAQGGRWDIACAV